MLGVLHRVLGVLHRVLGTLHRVLGVLHRVLGVQSRDGGRSGSWSSSTVLRPPWLPTVQPLPIRDFFFVRTKINVYTTKAVGTMYSGWSLPAPIWKKLRIVWFDKFRSAMTAKMSPHSTSLDSGLRTAPRTVCRTARDGDRPHFTCPATGFCSVDTGSQTSICDSVVDSRDGGGVSVRAPRGRHSPWLLRTAAVNCHTQLGPAGFDLLISLQT